MSFLTKSILIENGGLIRLIEPKADGLRGDNVVFIEPTGEVKWVIETFELSGKVCYFSGIWFEDGKLIVYSVAGVECEVDIATGKILHSEFVR